MPLGDHLEELRKRLIHALYGLAPIFVLSLVFGQHLLGFLISPLQHALLASGHDPAPLATEPLEVFGAYIKVSLIGAVVVGSPWVLFQIWRFVAPGLYDREKRFVYFLLPLSAILTTSGLLFLFRVVMPLILAFFLQFGVQIGVLAPIYADLPPNTTLPKIVILDGDPKSPAPGETWFNKRLNEERLCISVSASGVPEILARPMNKAAGIRQDFRVASYISLLLSLSIAFAVAFQTPVVVLLLGWAGFIDVAFHSKFRRHALFGCAIAAALMTPGDVASMLLLWIPLYALYELGGLLLRMFPASRVAAGFKGKEPDAAAD